MKKDVVRGVVLRAVDVKDSDLMLTVYTHERGLMSIYARGAKKRNNTAGAAGTAELSYSEFTIVEKHAKIWSSEIVNLNYFACSILNYEYFAVDFYITELYNHIATAEPDEELMRLLLNTLYASAASKYDPYIMKGACEMRLLSRIGYMPDLSGCSECGAHGELYFDIATGSLLCRECSGTVEREGDSNPTVIITEGARAALEYVTSCPIEKIFSFTLAGEDLECFSVAAERYTLYQLDRDFFSLNMLHDAKRPCGG